MLKEHNVLNTNEQKMAAGDAGTGGNNGSSKDAVMAEQQEKSAWHVGALQEADILTFWDETVNKLYGGLPKKTVVNRAPTNARKYFDSYVDAFIWAALPSTGSNTLRIRSGDYALAKAGKTSEQDVGVSGCFLHRTAGRQRASERTFFDTDHRSFPSYDSPRQFTLHRVPNALIQPFSLSSTCRRVRRDRTDLLNHSRTGQEPA